MYCSGLSEILILSVSLKKKISVSKFLVEEHPGLRDRALEFCLAFFFFFLNLGLLLD